MNHARFIVAVILALAVLSVLNGGLFVRLILGGEHVEADAEIYKVWGEVIIMIVTALGLYLNGERKGD